MDALEFLRNKKRMCKSCDNCADCLLELSKQNISCTIIKTATEEQLKQRIAIVEQWPKEHPRKTYKQDLIEKFPKANTYGLCRDKIYGKIRKCYIECYGVPEDYCEKCWNEEMEE